MNCVCEENRVNRQRGATQREKQEHEWGLGLKTGIAAPTRAGCRVQGLQGTLADARTWQPEVARPLGRVMGPHPPPPFPAGAGTCRRGHRRQVRWARVRQEPSLPWFQMSVHLPWGRGTRGQNPCQALCLRLGQASAQVSVLCQGPRGQVSLCGQPAPSRSSRRGPCEAWHRLEPADLVPRCALRRGARSSHP